MLPRVGSLSFRFPFHQYSHGFPVHLLSGGKKHVTAVSDPVSGLSSGRSGDPSAGSANQSERSGPHRRRGTHVHKQPGDPHQVPRFKVRHQRLSQFINHTSQLRLGRFSFHEAVLFCLICRLLSLFYAIYLRKSFCH